MIVIVAILIIFGAVVRHKWKNAAAKKEEILRLLAAASAEEAEIAKLQTVDVYFSPSQPPPQIEKRYYCAVCCCPTTTRCSKCKAVRYCSGKCQIIHWRQGHKVECRPASSLHASKESARVMETALENQFGINLKDEAKVCSDPTEKLDNTGSSSSSLPCFSSSTERSETSSDASTCNVLESGTSVGPDKFGRQGIDSHISQTASDLDEANSPLNSTIKAVNKKSEVDKIKSSQASRFYNGFNTSFQDERSGDGSALPEDFVLGTVEFRNSKSFGSLKPSSSMENHNNQAQRYNGRVTKSKHFRRSGNHSVPNVDIRSSPCSESLSTTTSEDFWGSEAQICTVTETRASWFGSLEDDQRMSGKTGCTSTFLSKSEGAQTSLQPTSKALRTSVRKFVQHFTVSKQSKSCLFDMAKESTGNYKKIIFPPKLFMQLYSCEGVELHPVGLVNCGNSCYANAVLQCLTFTRPIAAYLLQGFHSKTCRKRDWCLICEFEHLIRKGHDMKSPLSPVGILSQIQRTGSHLIHGREEDAHDFLRNMVDTMQSIWLEEAHVSGSLAEDLTLLGLSFGGYLRSKIKCMKCLGRSEQCDRMMDLTVEIDGDIYSLEEALAQFTISETLAGDDMYKCSRCKSYERAKKKLTIIKAPNILTIVFKRFQSGNIEKLNKLVQFPVVLNLTPYMSGTSDKYPIYHLYAVVVHLNMMHAAHSGHYISYVQDFRGEWFRIDDSRVNHVDLETVLSAEAYILFYARHTAQAPSSLTSSSSYSDGKTKRNMEAISSSTSAKKKNVKSEPISSDFYSKSPILHHMVDYEDWGSHYQKYPTMDSPSNSSSIFSVSDAGSYSTDSTKDLSAEDIPGYIFRSSSHHP